jgi:hypothetical protein
MKKNDFAGAETTLIRSIKINSENIPVSYNDLLTIVAYADG